MGDAGDRVAVVGVGLMGGSLGLALQARAGATAVCGFDPDPEALARALARGAITEMAGSLLEAVRDTRVVFVAAPVTRTPDLVRAAIAATGDDCVITDVGSSKGAVLGALGPRERGRFIGGHPICGSERGGVEHARDDLFVGATYFLTPSEETRPQLYQRLHGLVTALGARPTAIDAGAHDRILALVSHLPHVVASALIDQAASTTPEGREALRSAGPSFADLTRVAGANPPLWADILLANGDAVVEAITEQRRRLAEVADAIRRGERDWLRAFMDRAAAGRARLREAPAAVDDPWRVVVGLANRPGALSEVATALGHAHVNIEDLQLRTGAGEQEGELALVVSGREVAELAERTVAARGYEARVEAVGADA